ncbi:MAG: phosphatidylserine decarboxylase [Alphaproteobacteria bacterium]|nr:phosphatidylserine decarboxylase [Alphaproteobacteria bacterium]
MRIHSDGWKFVGIFAAVTLLFFVLSTTLGWMGILLTAWCVYFFRNPERMTPSRKGLIVSPADGKVVGVREVVPPKDFDMGDAPRTRISIFLNVFDVHVNRLPIGGSIKKVIYHPGKFFNASLDKASEHNERNTLVIDMGDGHDLAVIQIAGLIARRIRCDVNEGDAVLTGERYGLIRFGSRADIYLPKGVKSLVIEGQYMISGETVLADIASNEDQRDGTYR